MKDASDIISNDRDGIKESKRKRKMTKNVYSAVYIANNSDWLMWKHRKNPFFSMEKSESSAQMYRDWLQANRKKRMYVCMYKYGSMHLSTIVTINNWSKLGK
jgi:hypothetical protein